MLEIQRPSALCPECSPSGGETVRVPFVDYRCPGCGWLWRYYLGNFARRLLRSACHRPKSMQARWDEQVKRNLAASHFGRGRESRMIGARMRHCPNNPRNGGDGFDTGDGAWRDRRWKIGL